MAHALPHYVRTYRKLSGLSQRDAAALCGLSSNSLSCIELRHALPSFESALALAVVLQLPVEALFAGLMADQGQDVLNRARVRMQHLEALPRSSDLERRCQALQQLIRALGPLYKDED